jgi:hypothetical protein
MHRHRHTTRHIRTRMRARKKKPRHKKTGRARRKPGKEKTSGGAKENPLESTETQLADNPNYTELPAMRARARSGRLLARERTPHTKAQTRKFTGPFPPPLQGRATPRRWSAGASSAAAAWAAPRPCRRRRRRRGRRSVPRLRGARRRSKEQLQEKHHPKTK